MTATRAHYKVEGFTIVPNLLSSSEVEAISTSVLAYLRTSEGRRHAPMMAGLKLGGWYIADFPSIPPLSGILTSIREKPRLKEMLKDLLGPYRLLSRSEMYIDRVSPWHMDGLFGPYSLYNGEIELFKKRCNSTLSELETTALRRSNLSRDALLQVSPAHRGNSRGLRDAVKYARQRYSCEWTGWQQVKVAWERLEKGETQQIATVAIYLQDHWENLKGLSIKPRTHASSRHWHVTGPNMGKAGGVSEESNFTSLHYAKGDAVVFDARLLHRGITLAAANLQRSFKVPHRMVVSITFGRKNAFSEAFDRGFAMRGRVYSSNSSICNEERRRWGDVNPRAVKSLTYAGGAHSLESSECVYTSIKADLRERPLAGAAEAARMDDDAALRHTQFLENLGTRLRGSK